MFRFPIVNSTIVELAKPAILCMYRAYVITQNQILVRIAIVFMYKILLVWPLLYGVVMLVDRQKNMTS